MEDGVGVVDVGVGVGVDAGVIGFDDSAVRRHGVGFSFPILLVFCLIGSIDRLPGYLFDVAHSNQ